jgi:hypothetical protein
MVGKRDSGGSCNTIVEELSTGKFDAPKLCLFCKICKTCSYHFSQPMKLHKDEHWLFRVRYSPRLGELFREYCFDLRRTGRGKSTLLELSKLQISINGKVLYIEVK